MKQTNHSEYTASMLPQTRRAVFFDVVQLHWKRLLLLGFLLLLSGLPLLLTAVLKDLRIANVYGALQTADEAQRASAGEAIVYMDVLFSLINIPLMALFAVGLSGVLRAIRQFAWLENVHLPTDLPKGIRDNFGHTALLGILTGLIYTLCLMGYYNASAGNSRLLSALMLLPVGISALVIAPIFAIALGMIPVYTNKLLATLKNAFVVYVRSFWKVLLTLILCLSIWVPSLLPNFYCHLFGTAAAMVLLPFSLLAWTLFCYDRFDEHINPLVSPELIGRGIVWDF